MSFDAFLLSIYLEWNFWVMVCALQILPIFQSVFFFFSFAVSFCWITNNCSVGQCSEVDLSGMVHLWSVCVGGWFMSSFTWLVVSRHDRGNQTMGHSSCDKLACAYFTCWWWQGCREQQKRTNFNILTLFKPLPVSHLLMPHWPKHVTWPTPDSRNGEIDLLEKASAKSDCMC